MATLTSPIADPDEPSFIALALRGHYYLWDIVLPPADHHLKDWFDMGFFRGHFLILHKILATFGVGLWQMRIFPMVCGLLSLWILIKIVDLLELPWTAKLAVLMFNFTFNCFYTFHNVRPEPILLLITLLNFLWLVKPGARASGFFAGWLAISGFAFHPGMIFFTLTFPFAAYWIENNKVEGLKKPRYFWWLAGSVLGAVTALSILDFKQGMQYVSYAGPAVLSRPAVLKPSELPTKILDYLTGFRDANVMWGPLLILLLSCAIWNSRRFNELSKDQKFVTNVSILFLVVYLFLTPSRAGGYKLYFFPWFFVLAGTALMDVWNGKGKINDRVLYWYGCGGMLVFTLLFDVRWPIVDLMILIFFFGFALISMNGKYLRLIGLICVLLAMHGVHPFIFKFFQGQIMLMKLVDKIFFLLLLSPIAYWCVAGFFRANSFNINRHCLYWILIILTLNVVECSDIFIRDIRHSKFSSEFSQELAEIDGKKVLGPSWLIVYSKPSELQALPLFDKFIETQFFTAIDRYKPEIVVCPEIHSKDLLSALEKNSMKILDQKIVESPFGRQEFIRLKI